MNRIALFLLALGTGPCLAAQTPDRLADEEVVERVQQLLSQVIERPDAVGLSVGIGRNERLLLETGVGRADLEFDVPANARTIFRIGSVTKQFTAAAILKLAERGKLSLDDALDRFVPTFDTGGRKVTIRQLLNHTSGVPSYTSQPRFRPEGFPRELTHAQLLEFVKGVPFDFEPGAGWRYSNTGYYLLGMIIEAVDGRPYARFMQEEFFAPLGLARTRYGSEREVIPNRAQGYGRDPASGEWVNDDLIHMNTPGAAGALSASAGDLVRWQIALVNGRAVSAASFTMMVESSVPVAPGQDRRYGFGLEIGQTAGQRSLSHGGGIPGFNSVLTYLPESGLHVAVISNSEALPSAAVQQLIIRSLTATDRLPALRTTQHPDAGTALRRLISELASGEPDYARMGSQLASATRAQLPQIRAQLTAWGPVRSMTYLDTDLQEADAFRVVFANGQAARISIGIDADGRIQSAALQPEAPITAR